MEVGCYTLDLYCDHDNVNHSRFPDQYTGRTLAECRRAARWAGWRFHRNGAVSCPKCSNTKKPPTP